MTSRLSMVVSCGGKSAASKLGEVMAPDNRELPAGLGFTMERTGNELVFELASQRDVTVLTSLVGILEDIALFQEVWLLSRPTKG